MKRFRGIKNKPRVLKTNTRASAFNGGGYYVHANVNWIGGRSASLNFPCTHSPSFKALKARLEIIKDEFDIFNSPIVVKRFGGQYKVVRS